jgi:hypothetical protein
MNKLLKYRQQRFKIWPFLSLSVLILLLSKNNIKFGIMDAYVLIQILVFLFSMRLYDDLKNAAFDFGKPNRDYTLKENKADLTKSLIVTSIIAVLLHWNNTSNTVLLVAFFISNHLLYFLFFKHEKGRFILPLIKYAFIVSLICNGNILLGLMMFLVMFAFDLASEPQAPFSRKLIYPALVLVFAVFYSQNSTLFYVFPAIGLTITIVAMAIQYRHASYLLLANLLILKLIHLFL